MTPDAVVSIFGMVTGILTMGALAWGLVRIFQGPVGQALARRIQSRGGSLPDVDLLNEVADLRNQVDHLQHRLLEAEERLDFSERLLAQRTGAGPEGRPQ